MSNFEPRIDFEESWNHVEKRIKKVLDNLECFPNTHLSSEDNIMIYTDIYNMGFMHNSFVYDKYKEVIYDYIISTVLPSLEGKKDEVLLRELLRRWSNPKTMTNCLSKFFLHLELKYIPRTILPSLEETSFLSFYNLVYDRLHTQVMDAILAMIDRKLVGDTIDGTLVNNILVFYSEIGEKTRKEEPKQFAETMMMKANETFYMHVEASD